MMSPETRQLTVLIITFRRRERCILRTRPVDINRATVTRQIEINYMMHKKELQDFSAPSGVSVGFRDVSRLTMSVKFPWWHGLMACRLCLILSTCNVRHFPVLHLMTDDRNHCAPYRRIAINVLMVGWLVADSHFVAKWLNRSGCRYSVTQ